MPYVKAVAFAVCAAILVLPYAKAENSPRSVAYRNATIETLGPYGRIDGGTIVIRDRVIVAIGSSVDIPLDAVHVDATGMTIMPGIIDPYWPITIPGSPDQQPEERTIVVRGRRINIPNQAATPTGPFSRVTDSFYPYDIQWASWHRSGVALANVVTRGQGQSALIHTDPADPDKMIFQRDGLVFVAVSNDTNSLDVVRRALEQATRGSRGAGGGAGRAGVAAGETAGAPRDGQGTDRPAGAGQAAAADRWPANLWRDVAEGKSPLIVNVNNAAAINHVLAVLDSHPKVDLILVTSGAQLERAMNAVVRRKPKLILAPSIETVAFSRDLFNPARMAHEAGIPFAFSAALDAGVMRDNQDSPLLSVALLTRSGLPRDVALAALTVRPAEMLGLANRYGTLEVGKSASLAMFDGDPLDPASRLTQLLVDGNVVYERQ